MGLERDWLQLGSTTVSWEAFTGFDVDGSPLFAASTTLVALVQAARRNVFFADGHTETSRVLIFVLSTSVHIGQQDRILEPGSTQPVRILSVDHVGDEGGQHHVEVVGG